MTAKSIKRQIERINNCYKKIGEGMYGKVYIDTQERRAYKVGNISRREFNFTLKAYKEGLAPKPYTIVGNSKLYIFKMEYIDGWLLDDLVDYYYNDETYDLEWDQRVLLDFINSLQKLHCVLKIAHNDLHGENIKYNGSFYFLDWSAASKDRWELLNEIKDLRGLPIPNFVNSFIHENLRKVGDEILHTKKFFIKLNEFYENLKTLIKKECK